MEKMATVSSGLSLFLSALSHIVYQYKQCIFEIIKDNDDKIDKFSDI